MDSGCLRALSAIGRISLSTNIAKEGAKKILSNWPYLLVLVNDEVVHHYRSECSPNLVSKQTACVAKKAVLV